MPAVLSKLDSISGGSFVGYLFKNTKHKVITSSVIAIILLLVKLRFQKAKEPNAVLSPKKLKKGGKGNVDAIFLKRIKELLKIVLPTWKCMEAFDLLQLTVFLIFRTFLSIYISSINGRIVKSIISMKWNHFLVRIGNLAMCAVPASFVNSYLDFLNKRLAIGFRKRLNTHFNKRYIDKIIYYRLSNLDNRIANPEQRLTQDIEKWANSLSQIYSNLTKPVLDIVLFSRRLAEILTWRGPIYTYLWYLFSGIILRFISPPFGRLTAVEQQLEGEYRACHTDLLKHAEGIAFYRGHDWEKKRVNESLKKLITHQRIIMYKRLFMGCFDTFLVKYGAVLIGYFLLGLPVFGPGHEEYLKKVGSDASNITRDYIRNSSLLINLAKAIGRLVVSYKEIQLLAGYTTLVHEMKEVIGDLEQNKYKRTMINNSKDTKENREPMSLEARGQSFEHEHIKFEDIPIVTPNGEVLVEKMAMEVEHGVNVVITGPNGCGKSSLFRILGDLWPLAGGKLYRPPIDQMFYVPQRPYLPPGTLRDQVIYPHSKYQMLKRKIKDENIRDFLKEVDLEHLADREGGLDSDVDWKDVLSGGEKQRIAMARLYYHKPRFAILDECTSMVSVDIEAKMYTHCKELGITLFTVSHRQSLMKYHEINLKYDGEGGYKLIDLKNQQ